MSAMSEMIIWLDFPGWQEIPVAAMQQNYWVEIRVRVETREGFLRNEYLRLPD